MLTGWLDRVLVRGVAWELPDGASRITPQLTNIRRLVAITSHGSSKLVNIVEGETGRRVDRPGGARAVPPIRPHDVAGDVQHRPSSSRQIAAAFLDRVERRMQPAAPLLLRDRCRSKVVTTST